jgi:PAS domain S-box-containing protein
VLGVARNVTERKRIEEEQRRAEIAEAARKALENEVAERKQIEEQLRYRLTIEEALARASRLFMITTPPDFTLLLNVLGEAVGANRAYLFFMDKEGKTISNTHEWCDRTTESWLLRLQDLRPEDFPWLSAQLEKGETIIVADTDALPLEAKRERDLITAQRVRAFLAVPIRSRRGLTIGFLGFETVDKSHFWSDEDVRLLSVVSEMIANYLARKRAEDALRAAERDYRAIFENAVEGIYRSSLDGHQLRANPALVRLNGYRSEEEMLPAVNDIATEWYVDPHRREEFKRILEAQGTVTEFESEVYRHKTRERIWIAETARLVRDEHGAPLYYEGTVQDISARKRAEEALREREARLAAIFRAVSDVIVTFDLEGVITDVNWAIERVLGYKPEEVIGGSTDILVAPESAAFARARAARALQGEPLPALFELQGQHKNGALIPLEVSASFLYEDGRRTGLVGVLRDVSLKKELEQQRADFLAMLTHDIKNPMNAILGCAELLLGEEVNGEQRKLLQRLRGNALTVHSLVTNYLDLSKVESGHLALVRQPLGINSLLHHVEQQYASEASRRNVTLLMHLQGELPLVDGDSLALERVFANLLHNALKFTPQSGQIIIRSFAQPDAVVVMIADSGPGIAHDDIASLFEKYRRAKQARTTDGAGLGLFIVKALVEAHGGQVRVESAPGQGACFSVFLPIASRSSRASLLGAK